MKWIKIVISVCCYTVFILMSKEQYDNFKEEPTGSALSGETVSDLPFPAITICDNHYENARAYEEERFPKNAMGGKPQTVTKDTLNLYEKLITFDLPIVPKLWSYYFTLDKILLHHRSYYRTVQDYCRVGPVPCGYKEGGKVMMPDGNDEVFEMEVPAGKWISRFLADSYQGTTHLCHTLIPNVTISFEVSHGNSIAIKWAKKHALTSTFWTVYIHDKNEHVLLDSYALKILPSVTVPKYENNLKEHKKKVLVLPKLTKYPSPSTKHLCGNEKEYSENWCDIQWGWQEKMKLFKDVHGDNFTCRLPGVWSNMNEEYPVCKIYDTAEKGSLGFVGLLAYSYRYGKKVYILVSACYF